LTAELRTGVRTIPATDEHGHGTAAAGVAAGNGNSSGRTNRQVIGVAPEADLIGVRLGGPQGAMENGYLLNAVVAWLDEVARREGKPLVVSCSFGGQHGGHDGGSVEERELDARFAANVQGRAIVIAAGNEQQDGLHAQLFTKGPGERVRFAWQAKRPTIVSFYVRPQGAVSGSARDLTGDIAFGSLGITINGVRTPDAVLLRAYPNPLTGDTVAQFVVPEGWQGLEFASKTGAALQFDGYVSASAAFHPEIRRMGEIVGTPGTASGAITVGSYDWNDLFNYKGELYTLKDPCGNAPMKIGGLSCYSSVGYNRTSGVVKPDITAPGEWYTASYAHLPDGSGVRATDTIVESSGKYRAFNGTSAATPYTSGIIALMLQKKPALTSGEIKSLLRRNATSDGYTGPVPNPAWGYGKLDLAAVRAIIRSL
jgi:subtilisin family serine protease